MTNEINIEERKPVWSALSEFYLDTELQESDYCHIAATIIDSPYSIDEVKKINKYEVFPVLQPNLLSIAGEWAGFDEEWLTKLITDSLSKRNVIKKIAIEGFYKCMSWIHIGNWKRTKKAYHELKNDPNSYFLICREVMKNKIEPFEFSKFDSPEVRKLLDKASEYKKLDQYETFCKHLEIGRYWTFIWTAYYLLEYFEVSVTDKCTHIGDEANTVNLCLWVVSQNFQYFRSEESKLNAEKWLSKIKSKYNIQ